MDFEHYQEGIELFNKGAYFDAHEVLEDVWRAASEHDKRFLQGLIQIAVAFHHYGNGNLRGARSVLRRACLNLSQYPGDYGGVDLASLMLKLTECQRAFDVGVPVSSPPRIICSNG